MWRTLLAVLALSCLARVATAEPAVNPGALCQRAAEVAAQARGVPARLMAAIGRVESGRRDQPGATVVPWPWTIDAEGQGTFYDSEPQAIAAAQALQARGVRSIDVGCMQVNLMHHPHAFADLAQAFDPAANADYAARFLHELFGQTGTWPKAAAMYHSATPELAADYQRKVMAAWTDVPPQQRPAPSPAFAGGWVGALNPGGLLPPRRTLGGRALPLAPGGAREARGLASYRAAPVMLRTADAGIKDSVTP
ncbi:MAG TPA: lytic transglycosylase domain-containing protein [Acetobacteraceae bacterium]|jgi:hypothetical protein